MPKPRFSSRLRPRVNRVRGKLKGRRFRYHPISDLTHHDDLEEGERVEVVSEPIGEGKHKLVEVKNFKGKKISVLLQDLAVIH